MKPEQLEIDMAVEMVQNNASYKAAMTDYHLSKNKGYAPLLCFNIKSKEFFSTIYFTKKFIESQYENLRIII